MKRAAEYSVADVEQLIQQRDQLTTVATALCDQVIATQGEASLPTAAQAWRASQQPAMA